MTKNLILAFSSFLVILISFQSAFGQNHLTIKGNVNDYDNSKHLPGVRIESYNGKKLLNKTDTDFKDGSFSLSTMNSIDKVVFSYPYFHPLIIENINNFEGIELNLGTIKLFEIQIEFTRYISKKAEREGRKEDRRKLKKLKKGIIINSGNRNYKIQLKKRKGKFAFYVDFRDFEKN